MQKMPGVVEDKTVLLDRAGQRLPGSSDLSTKKIIVFQVVGAGKPRHASA